MALAPRRLGLRHRMALSYLATSVLVILVGLLIGRATTERTLWEPLLVVAADQTARDLAATGASSGGESSARTRQGGNQEAPSDGEFGPPSGHGWLRIPDTYGLRSAEVTIDPVGTIVTSSRTGQFPVGGALPGRVPVVGRWLPSVLLGYPAEGDDGGFAWALEPVLSGVGQPLGAVYVQIDEPGTSIWSLAQSDLVGLLAVTLVLAPVGALFGILTMWSTVRRITGLVEASRALAAGDFSRRVRPRGCDEVATLQRQFNLMAGRLQTAVGTLQELAATDARIAERDRIARELHDSISQELFSLRMAVGGLEVGQAGDGALRGRLHEVGRSLTGVIRQMRVLLLELGPGPAAATDLPAALRELAACYRSRVGLQVEVSAAVEPESLPDRVGQGLLRIAQEALANAARHSGATRVELGLHPAAAGVELRIADNGRGFDPAAAEANGGLGLRLLRERAADLGGELRVESAAGAGARVVVTVPGC